YRTTDAPKTADENYSIGVVRQTIEHAIALSGATTYTFADVVNHLTTNAADRIPYAVYNPQGEAADAIHSTGAVTGFAYDAAGRVTKTTRFATLYSANLGSSISSTWLATMVAWAGGQASNVDNRITRTWYTERGEVRYVVEADRSASGNDW